jgi:hypothetical protein
MEIGNVYGKYINVMNGKNSVLWVKNHFVLLFDSYATFSRPRRNVMCAVKSHFRGQIDRLALVKKFLTFHDKFPLL